MDDDRGFSLLETLVAITILATVTVAFTTGMTTGWRGITAAAADMRALALARNELARAGVEWSLASGSRHGVSPDGLPYSVVVTPVTAATTDVALSAKISAYWITVEVPGNGRRRPVRLQTLKSEGLQ